MSAQGSNARFSRIVETTLAAETVSGEVVFDLNGHAARNNLMEYFYFVNANGDLVEATDGEVLVQLSPVAGIYQDIDLGSFSASEARNSTWKKPNGFGKAISIKISFTGITGDPTGFRALVTQSVS